MCVEIHDQHLEFERTRAQFAYIQCKRVPGKILFQGKIQVLGKVQVHHRILRKNGLRGCEVMSRTKHLVELQQLLHLRSKKEFYKGYIFRVKYFHMINSEFAIVFSMKNRVCA